MLVDSGTFQSAFAASRLHTRHRLRMVRSKSVRPLDLSGWRFILTPTCSWSAGTMLLGLS